MHTGFPNLRILRAVILMVTSMALLQANAGEPATESKPVSDWLPSPYARVVGYSFAYESDEPGTLIQGGKLNEAELRKITQKEVILSADQTKRLLAATFHPTEKMTPAACYTPHHIFVFYDAESKPIAAIEICFACMNIHLMPEKETDAPHDFEALARLSTELGLGLGPDATLDGFLKILKFRNGETE